MSQQENVGESRTASFEDAARRSRLGRYDSTRFGLRQLREQRAAAEEAEPANPWRGIRTVGFGDLDYEHGAKGPRYGSDENDFD